MPILSGLKNKWWSRNALRRRCQGHIVSLKKVSYTQWMSQQSVCSEVSNIYIICGPNWSQYWRWDCRLHYQMILSLPSPKVSGVIRIPRKIWPHNCSSVCQYSILNSQTIWIQWTPWFVFTVGPPPQRCCCSHWLAENPSFPCDDSKTDGSFYFIF